VICGAVIALGVYGEYTYASTGARANAQLQSISEREIADLNKESATLRKDAEDERLKRVEIEERVAWRRLTAQQQSEITSRQKAFSAETASVWCEAGDIEAATFASDIASALRAAKWKVLGPGSVITVAEATMSPPTPLPTGVVISSSGDDFSLRASDGVLREIASHGFDATLKYPRVESRQGPALWITIEARPQGAQGEAKLRSQR
jgi:hypothetical protein